MDYRYLGAFLAAGKCLNFTLAAKELNVTTAALSRQIKLLEQSLGKQLFIRSPQQVKLTEMGSKLYNISSRFKSDTNSLLENSEHKRIRIGVLTPILSGVLTQFISKYYKDDNHTSFDIFVGSPSEIIRRMKNGELDLGLCNKNIQTDLLTSEKWLTETPVLISKKKTTLSAINKQRWVLVEDKDYLINYAYKKRMKRSELITYVNSPLAQLQLVQEGLGIAIVSNWLVKDVKGVHKLEIKEFKNEKFYITQSNSMFTEPHISQFINKIQRVV